MPTDNRHISSSTDIDTHTVCMPDSNAMENIAAMTDPEVVRITQAQTITIKSSSSPRIYIASKTIHAPLWRNLRGKGYNIISTWIDESENGQTCNYSELSIRCIKEIRQSDFLIFYCEYGEIQNGSLVEMGVALAFGIEVRCVVDRLVDVNKVFRCHPSIRQFSGIYAALERQILWPRRIITYVWNSQKI